MASSSVGQQQPNDDSPPVFGPCKMLDFELEMAFVTFDGKPLGEPISTAEVHPSCTSSLPNTSLLLGRNADR